MKTNFITILLCGMLISLFTISQSNAQTRPLVVSGAPNPPGPISGATSVVMPTASSQYSNHAVINRCCLS